MWSYIFGNDKKYEINQIKDKIAHHTERLRKYYKDLKDLENQYKIIKSNVLDIEKNEKVKPKSDENKSNKKSK